MPTIQSTNRSSIASSDGSSRQHAVRPQAAGPLGRHRADEPVGLDAAAPAPAVARARPTRCGRRATFSASTVLADAEAHARACAGA